MPLPPDDDEYDEDDGVGDDVSGWRYMHDDRMYIIIAGRYDAIGMDRTLRSSPRLSPRVVIVMVPPVVLRVSW